MPIANANPEFSLLLDCCRRFADARAGDDLEFHVPIRGLSVVRSERPGELEFMILKPAIVLVIQGGMRLTASSSSFDLMAGEVMVIAADIPITRQITNASRGSPLNALVLELDPEILRELTREVPGRGDGVHSFAVGPVAPEIAEIFVRLVQRLEHPGASKDRAEGLVREIHYWLLVGQFGSSIRAIGEIDGLSDRIGRAVDFLRREFAQKVSVSDLAQVAGMTKAAFDWHFTSITMLSALQFQKHLRLIEARRLMVSDGAGVPEAAQAVGYTSLSQFHRDYARLFEPLPRHRRPRRSVQC